MLYRPQAQTVRLMGVDPGNTTLGIAVASVELPSGEMRIDHLYTINSGVQIAPQDALIEQRSERHVKQRIMGDRLSRAVAFYRPQMIAIESPFMHRMPQAFAALTELMLRLEDGVAEVDIGIPIYKVPPVQAKKAIGVKDIKSKASVKEALEALEIGVSERLWSIADEHALDAIAVVVTLAQLLINEEYPYVV